MPDNATARFNSGRPILTEPSPLGLPADLDVRSLGRRLPRTEAPEGWIKKIERSREGKVWVGFFHLWTTGANGQRVRAKKEKLTSLQLLVNKMAEDGYCKSAVGQIRTYIKACFVYATDEDLIEKSPARKLVLPNIRKKSCERFLTVDELRSLLAQSSPREHVVLRIEDFEGTQLRIDEALKERQRGEDRIGATKTAESDNFVPVPPDLGREIAAWIAGHSDRDNPRAFLFPNSAGTAFGVGNYLKERMESSLTYW